MTNRNVFLDYLRFFAIFLVFSYHFFGRFPFNEYDLFASFSAIYGKLGVDIFFPLSGYLITKSLIKFNSKEDLKKFYVRRFYRIVPIYFLALAVYSIASHLSSYEISILKNIWINFLFLTGWGIYLQGSEAIPYTITWSLSVEEFAYILFGLIAYILRERFFFGIIFILLSSFLLRVFLFYLYPESSTSLYYFPPARLDSIAIGSLTAIFSTNKSIKKTLIFFSSLNLILLLIYPGLTEIFLYPLIALVTSLIIVLVDDANEKPNNSDIFSNIGLYSYGLYLFHLFFIEFFKVLSGYVDSFFALNYYIYFAISFASSYLFCKLLFTRVESRFIEFSRLGVFVNRNKKT